MSLKNWVILLCVAGGSVLAAPLAAQEQEPRAQIVVIGAGEVSVPPDMAVITLGARHSAKSAADALAETNKAVAAILSRMTKLGVDPKDMQTATLGLNPIWGKSSRYEEGEVVPPVGFEASNTVHVTLRDLDKLGAVLDSVAREGANSFSGFRFGLIDPEPTQDEARKNAVSDARRKAELYAAAAGVSVGDILLITEDTNGGGGYPSPVMEMAAARSGAVPIAQGEVTQRASVRIVYAIGK
ncbi:MAG: SIMPL domain-containing protein [Planktotalea sp.]|uniref:SIMPL domain-containing protein n=1 Tax=Planktotalea sp. TaxID=2029877 RepID=UPI003C75B256